MKKVFKLYNLEILFFLLKTIPKLCNLKVFFRLYKSKVNFCIKKFCIMDL